MKWALLILLSLLAGFSATWAQESSTGKTLAATLEVYVFPKAGQTATQQSQDEAACYEWAVGQVGQDPFQLSKQAAQQQKETEQAKAQARQTGRGAGVRGAAGGAAAGAIIGEIVDDNPGKGAAIGAGVGAIAGRRKARRAQQQATQQAEQKARPSRRRPSSKSTISKKPSVSASKPRIILSNINHAKVPYGEREEIPRL